MTYNGSGNFISSVVPVGGSVLDEVSLSNTVGKTNLRTHVYDTELNGQSSYLDVLGSSGKWSFTITPGVPAPMEAPAEFSGKWGLRTALVHLAGDYTVTFKHAGSANFIVELVPESGSIIEGELLVNEVGKVSDSTQVYGLADGDYYLDVTGNGNWTVSISNP
jgi:hypothetical protein